MELNAGVEQRLDCGHGCITAIEQTNQLNFDFVKQKAELNPASFCQNLVCRANPAHNNGLYHYGNLHRVIKTPTTFYTFYAFVQGYCPYQALRRAFGLSRDFSTPEDILSPLNNAKKMIHVPREQWGPK